MMNPGILGKDSVIVSDQADGNTIYNKGYFGKPLSGGGLELDHYEALYLQETGRLDILNENHEVISKEGMMKEALKNDQDTAIRYSVYRDMRARGYVLKIAAKPADFRVFPRGGGPGKTPSRYWLIAFTETDPFVIDHIDAACTRISQIKKTLLVGLLDEEGDVTYYEVMKVALTGKGDHEPHGKKVKGTVFGDKCYLGQGGKHLHEGGFYGRISGDGLHLSLVETLYLMEKDLLTVYHGNTEETMDVRGLRDYADCIQNDFVLRYNTYRDLREKGLIPKTGFKYGTAYRCYAGVPDQHHADFMIQPVTEDFTCSWYDISRAVRVAHTVKKELVFARNLGDDSVSYVMIKRETP